MTLIIETNINVNDMHNFQSRVIEVENWDVYIKEIKQKEHIIRNAYIGNSYGSSLPRISKVDNIISDERSLSCDIQLGNGMQIKKLAYLIR